MGWAGKVRKVSRGMDGWGLHWQGRRGGASHGRHGEVRLGQDRQVGQGPLRRVPARCV